MTEQGEPPTEDIDIIELGGRYFLVAGDGFYGVWDSRGSEDPIERFPPTEEGLDAAEKRFRQLRRADRLGRGLMPAWLWLLIAVGAGVWFLAGLVTPLIFLFRSPGLAFDTVGSLAAFLDALGFRLFSVGLIVLIALTALRQRAREAESRESIRLTVWDRVLLTLLGAGLLAWIATTPATQWIFARRLDPLGRGPTEGEVWVQITETFAFRLWTAAVVVLMLRWGWAGLRGLVRRPDPRGAESEGS